MLAALNAGLAAVALLKTNAAPALVEALARALGPWQSLYSDSKVLSTCVD